MQPAAATSLGLLGMVGTWGIPRGRIFSILHQPSQQLIIAITVHRGLLGHRHRSVPNTSCICRVWWFGWCNRISKIGEHVGVRHNVGFNLSTSGRCRKRKRRRICVPIASIPALDPRCVNVGVACIGANQLAPGESELLFGLPAP
jgi:hypothetical protein